LFKPSKEADLLGSIQKHSDTFVINVFGVTSQLGEV